MLFNTLIRGKHSRLNRLQLFARRFAAPLRVCDTVLSVVTFVAAVAYMVLFTVYIGFDHSASEYRMLLRGVRAAQGVFMVNVVFNLLFNRGQTFKGALVLNWVVNSMVLVTLLPWIYPHPEHPWIPFLEKLLYSHYFLFTVLIIYSVVDISYSIMSILGKRTNPSLILSGSFVVFIIIGSFLLSLPKCTYGGISYVDALFVSTSAICITGLSPVDVSAIFTPFGILILGSLIQIGALGVMTFTSFFALFFTGSSSIYSQLLLRDIVYSKSMSSLIPTLLYVLGFTAVIEGVGAFFVWWSIHGRLGTDLEGEIVFALFHAVSAFCNAGFSTLHDGMSNPHLLYGNQAVYWVMSALIVAGAIGFPILVNFKDVAITYVRRAWTAVRRKPNVGSEVHIYSMNTKIALFTFFLLFILGAVAFFCLEYDNTLHGMTLSEKITQSVFNSATPRSAGFISVNPARFMTATLIVVMMLMWVGGASQSTAGGVKVNTLAAICLNLRAIVFGRERVTAYKRTVSYSSIRRANAVVAISILSFTFYAVVIVILEPGLGAKELLFETLSALFTVGSSLGVTAQLSASSKVVLCTAMFLGRVGIISLMAGLAGRHRSVAPHYPSDHIIIS